MDSAAVALAFDAAHSAKERLAAEKARRAAITAAATAQEAAPADDSAEETVEA